MKPATDSPYRDNPLIRKKKKDKRIRLSIFTSADLLCP